MENVRAQSRKTRLTQPSDNRKDKISLFRDARRTNSNENVCNEKRHPKRQTRQKKKERKKVLKRENKERENGKNIIKMQE